MNIQKATSAKSLSTFGLVTSPTRIRSRIQETKLLKSSAAFKGVSIFGASVNIANTIIGGGVLELPFVMSYFGVVLAIILFLMVFFITLCSVIFLLKSQEMTGENDYKSLARAAFDKTGGVITDCSIFIFDFGVCVAFLLIFEDSIERLLIEGFGVSETSFFCKKWVIMVFGGVLITPFLYAQSTKFLTFASTLSIVLTVFFLCIIVVDFWKR